MIIEYNVCYINYDHMFNDGTPKEKSLHHIVLQFI